jgi:hypothetical protein
VGDTRGVGASGKGSQGGPWIGEHVEYRQVMGDSYGGEILEENGAAPVKPGRHGKVQTTPHCVPALWKELRLCYLAELHRQVPPLRGPPSGRSSARDVCAVGRRTSSQYSIWCLRVVRFVTCGCVSGLVHAHGAHFNGRYYRTRRLATVNHFGSSFAQSFSF